jgi:CRP-like cAMP-binding protein
MDSRPSLSGSLGFISLAEIIQILGGNGSTGSLKISSRYSPTPGYIYFLNGEPVHSTCNGSQGTQAMYDLFGWTEGDFQFTNGQVDVGRTVRGNRMQIILDALRLLDEGGIRKIGPSKSDPSDSFGYGNIRNIPVIDGPVPDYMYIIQEERFPDGARIVQEGTYGNWIWVILEGSVDITRETDQGPVPVARLGQGCFIGTLLSLLHGVNRRTATVTAVGDVQLGLLDTLRLSGEYASLSNGFKAVLLSLTSRLFRITDRTVALLMSQNVANLLNESETKLMDADMLENGVYMIRGGETWVVSRIQRGYLPLCSLTEGDVFGRVPFLDIGHEPHLASIAAKADLETERVDVERLSLEYQRLSDTFKSLVHNVGSCIAETTRVACCARSS